jgi:hypothetical protein
MPSSPESRIKLYSLTWFESNPRTLLVSSGCLTRNSTDFLLLSFTAPLTAAMRCCSSAPLSRCSKSSLLLMAPAMLGSLSTSSAENSLAALALKKASNATNSGVPGSSFAAGARLAAVVVVVVVLVLVEAPRAEDAGAAASAALGASGNGGGSASFTLAFLESGSEADTTRLGMAGGCGGACCASQKHHLRCSFARAQHNDKPCNRRGRPWQCSC